MNKKDYIIELEKHSTKDTKDNHVNGELTVVWRDWDEIVKKEPRMIYVSSVEPNEIKGPHLHKNRTSYFSCIHGKVILIIRDEDGEFHEIELDSDKPRMVCVPNGIASAHVNIANEISRVLVLADIAWRPDDNEMINVEFENFDWDKFKI